MGRNKQVKVHTIAPIFLHKDDLKLLDETMPYLWARTRNDVFVQALRIAVEMLEGGRSRHFNQFVYPTENLLEGHAQTFRLTKDEVEYLDWLAERLRIGSRAETARMLIRFGRWYFEHAKASFDALKKLS